MYETRGNHKPKVYNRYTHTKEESKHIVIKSQGKRAKEEEQ